MSTIDINDPRLTAYALGELPVNEIAEIEAAINENPELQTEIDEIRAMTSMLEGAFAEEAELNLHDEHRQQIQATASETAPKKSIPFNTLLTRIVVPASAAMLVISLLVNNVADTAKEPSATSKDIEMTMGEIPAKPQLPPTAYTAAETEVQIERPAVTSPIVGHSKQLHDSLGKESLTLNDDNSGLIETNKSKLSLAKKKPESTPEKRDQLAKAEAHFKAKEYTKARNEIEGVLLKDAYDQKAIGLLNKTYKEMQKEGKVRRHNEMLQAAHEVEWNWNESIASTRSTAKIVPPRQSFDMNGDSIAVKETELTSRFSERKTFNTESYDHIVENAFKKVSDEALSTFSIDVDTASYANVRRFIKRNQLPPAGAVRIEEMINYFTYDYPQPEGKTPFSVTTDLSLAPWNSAHKLVRIGLKGREIAKENRASSNLVFLLDVSGSMNNPNKLPLLKKAFKMLVEQLGENDRVSIVVYAGASGLVLPSTSCDNKETILAALERLRAGGSTNGAGGIQLAYQTAVANFIEGGVNRVILATDGDFNVGTTNRSELTDLITLKAKSGVFLSVLGFGMGNYKDSTLENLADKGNGNYAYIDTSEEAEKVLVKEMGGTLITIAKDVKIQVDFNPAKVHAYRLIGYENRILAKEDFNDDTKDAGEIGAGHTVTALYEIIPVGTPAQLPEVEPSKYAAKPVLSETAANGELLEVRLRYKQPDKNTSSLLKVPLKDNDRSFADANNDFRFATGVATFGMLLRKSKLIQTMTYDDVIRMTEPSKDKPYRSEFLKLVKKARRLQAVK